MSPSRRLSATLAAVASVGVLGLMAGVPALGAGSAHTMAEVAAHGTAADCWSAIQGTVYDLTSWVAQHPGGSRAITSLCGTDGTAAFNAAHRGQGSPAQELASLAIGPLATGGASPSPTPSSTSSPTPSSSASAAAGTSEYSMREVRRHRRPGDCWTVVDGSVYDLSSWIASHRVGVHAVARLCGHDATRPLARGFAGTAPTTADLDSLRLGTLAQRTPGAHAPLGHAPDDQADDQADDDHGARPHGQGQFEHDDD